MDDAEYNKIDKELEDKLRPQLTEDFLNTLAIAVKTCGWSVDHIESSEFVEWCFDLAGVDRVDLTPYL